MFRYIVKRLLNVVPILIGVNLITFTLFFVVNTPDNIARMHLGGKHVSDTMVQQWKHNHGYDLPLFYNANSTGKATWTHTLFYTKSMQLFTFQFGASTQGRDIIQDIQARMWPSLAIALPTLLLGMLVHISCALCLVLFRHHPAETLGLGLCIALMSISGLFYIIGGQYLLAISAKLAPISGYLHGVHAAKFVVLPIIIGVLSGMGASSRWYHTIFQEELHKDYVRTARAKGLTQWQTLKRHVLRNALVPIVTGVVAVLPLLFMGSLLMEAFFAIPGLGSYTLDAIQQQDFEVVRVMVFIGTLLYMAGLMLTDVAYTWVDPRIRFDR